MTRKEIIDGLKFTVDMFLFNPSTGETLTEPRNDMDKTTIDACKGAIELLEKTEGDLISRTDLLNKIWQKEYGKDYDGVNMLNIPHIDIIENLPSYNSIKTELNGDLISRDYVLSKFKEQCERCGKYKENNGVMCRCCALDDAIDYVEEAPSEEKTDTDHYRVIDISYSPYTIDSTTTSSYSITIPTAEWVKEEGTKTMDLFRCSRCGRNIMLCKGSLPKNYPYCNCGSRMKGVE